MQSAIDEWQLNSRNTKSISIQRRGINLFSILWAATFYWLERWIDIWIGLWQASILSRLRTVSIHRIILFILNFIRFRYFFRVNKIQNKFDILIATELKANEIMIQFSLVSFFLSILNASDWYIRSAYCAQCIYTDASCCFFFFWKISNRQWKDDSRCCQKFIGVQCSELSTDLFPVALFYSYSYSRRYFLFGWHIYSLIWCLCPGPLSMSHCHSVISYLIASLGITFFIFHYYYSLPLHSKMDVIVNTWMCVCVIDIDMGQARLYPFYWRHLNRIFFSETSCVSQEKKKTK